MYHRNPSHDFYPVCWQARIDLQSDSVEAVKIIGIAKTGAKIECSHSISSGNLIPISFYLLFRGTRVKIQAQTCVTRCNLIRDWAVVELAFSSISKKNQEYISGYIDGVEQSWREMYSF